MKARTVAQLHQGPDALRRTGRNMLISLIVCTKNRAASLVRCLSHVRALRMDPADWELVIVDNASTDETAQVVAHFASSVDFRVVALHDRGRGTGVAKNTAIAHSSGSVLAFTDDDCLVTPELLQ